MSIIKKIENLSDEMKYFHIYWILNKEKDKNLLDIEYLNNFFISNLIYINKLIKRTYNILNKKFKLYIKGNYCQLFNLKKIIQNIDNIDLIECIYIEIDDSDYQLIYNSLKELNINFKLIIKISQKDNLDFLNNIKENNISIEYIINNDDQKIEEFSNIIKSLNIEYNYNSLGVKNKKQYSKYFKENRKLKYKVSYIDKSVKIYNDNNDILANNYDTCFNGYHCSGTKYFCEIYKNSIFAVPSECPIQNLMYCCSLEEYRFLRVFENTEAYCTSLEMCPIPGIFSLKKDNRLMTENEYQEHQEKIIEKLTRILSKK